MKKVFAILLAVCMLASVAAIFSIPAAAADKAWVVYGNAGDYRDSFNEENGDEYSNVPGYKYTFGVGLQTISPDWENTAPKLGVQTGEKVNLKDGVYMLVRIDEFSYDAGDKWFAFSISDTQYVNVGSGDKEEDGERVVGIIREPTATNLAPIQWRYSNFVWDQSGIQMSTPKEDMFDENGCALLALEITWDPSKETYSVNINGAKATATTIAWMNEHFADGYAYVGINLFNGKQGGDAGLTVLKYGTSKLSAMTPFYLDSQKPEKKEDLYKIAEIAGADTVPEGKPAIFINGSSETSDSKFTVTGSDTLTLTEEGYKHIVADRTEAQVYFSVKNSVSYDIKDFPVGLVLTRNYCNCEDDCWAYEQAKIYLMSGADIAPDGFRCVSATPASGDTSIKCEDGDYLFYVVNFAEAPLTADAEGRIHGIRFDLLGIDVTTPGKNEFDICFAAFFRNETDATNYAYEFLGIDPNAQPETDTETETETDTETETETETATETETQTESETETDAKTETKAPVTGDDAATSGGCFGTVGFGAIAIVAVVAVAGFVTLKKKD